MFDENFTFDTASRSPSLDSSNAPSTRSTSRSVSPCSAIGPSPSPRFSITDLAAQLADQRLRTESRINHDSCEAYAADDDDAGWAVQPSIEAEEVATSYVSSSRRSSVRPRSPPTQRSQRQANARLLCMSSHRQDIAALVASMVNSKEQCSVSSGDSLARIQTISEDDEGYDDSSDGLTPVQSRRSSVANFRRMDVRRASDSKGAGACVKEREDPFEGQE
ncbi:hypothetical protein LTR56_004619 [Elasticomyces elasticus]|nr:hypothetical protein LTR56_004619 [Elasticomyces elasticus]KAK4925959.1 hypothetical protein LTR49_007097 [Elasticomyces elasticus]KAK5768195.1 hypothetical protein LTS12_001679 [Elasticomyces elasticus]